MRDLDSVSKAESKKDLLRPFSAVELDYPDGIVRLSFLPFDVVIDGHTFTGAGELGAMSMITEGAEQKSYGITIAISGIPSVKTDYLLKQDIQGRIAKIWMGFLNENHQLIGKPIVIFVGRMDTQLLKVGKTTEIELAVESLFIDWQRAKVRRFTNEDQVAEYPNDRGFEFVSAVADMELIWGRG
ncbi:hypothetical protein [Actinobacillus vicugnae]|uniref:hypothetical protein n=1 Tax=Actinobacillus vicugnae TaxID=2573093 RepID=UPI001FCA9FAB|nr:hypothetical protein [Actinobacillus vicugnae]